ncbi:hypothetical protein Q0N71_30870, partial [Bacillus thuringiensis]|uniref:hypothetical protein n=1 Tax=Bacillus thuringiensis TaxID=1428 RepID=UPI003458613C
VADGYQNNIFFKLFSFKVSHVSFSSTHFPYSLASFEKLCNRTVFCKRVYVFPNFATEPYFVNGFMFFQTLQQNQNKRDDTLC